MGSPRRGHHARWEPLTHPLASSTVRAVGGALRTPGKVLASGLVSFVIPAPSEAWALAKLRGCQLEGHGI